ncbi:cobalt-precorrin 5A hydrolase [Levilactobacillus yiduensis]|uniref:cobalt-precorrin 5A hydrolase n=1 Tax=Levilactobacillus yiduensis TaxID=2953880 RepID=UPI002157B619|nr:cobalt-precorrin 5A hydrolase [Levilactobacillus yiduensis]
MTRPNKRVAILALTATGVTLARRLQSRLRDQQLAVQVVLPAKFAQGREQSYASGQFKSAFRQAFTDSAYVICIMATGIVVRTLAPLVQDKRCDPAVLVMDERGQHVISLLSGHVGGANAFTKWISELIKADPVITTATDVAGVQALDVLAKQLHAWYPEFKRNTKQINGRLAAGKPVSLWIAPEFQSQVTNTRGFQVVTDLAAADPTAPLIAVTDQQLTVKRDNLIPMIPRLDVLGVGCRKSVTNAMMFAAFSEFCQQEKIAWHAIDQIASIEKKAHETAIHELAATLDVPATFYSANQLRASSAHYAQSDFVKKTVGIGNVACAAADFASGQRVVTPRYAGHEITFALGRKKQTEMSE